MNVEVKDNMNIIVTGSGGFIGGHLVGKLLNEGHKVRAVDIKPFNEWEQVHKDAYNWPKTDLQLLQNCKTVIPYRADEVYALSCAMGGMGFIENNRAECMTSVLMSTHTLIAAKEAEVKRYFYSGSACCYNTDMQSNDEVVELKEEDAYPAKPEIGYGEEKLFTERMCQLYREDYGLETRVARFHNVFGPEGCYKGGREKAPAAISRKVATAVLTGKHEIEIWGDGSQVRTFMYIDDCLKGIDLIMHSDIREPINLGTNEIVTINQLVDTIEKIAGIKLKRTYKLDAPKGVHARSSDNTKIKQYLNWEPNIPLKDGLEKTYAWVYDQVKSDLAM